MKITSQAVFQYDLLQSCRFVQPQHDIHVLDGGAGGAFAEIVKEGGDAGLVLVAADDDLQAVGAGQLRCVEGGGVCGEGQDADEMAVRLIDLQGLADLLCSGGSA